MNWLYRTYVATIALLGAACLIFSLALVRQEIISQDVELRQYLLFFLLGLVLNGAASQLTSPGRRFAMAFFAPILLVGPLTATLMGAAASLLQVIWAQLRLRLFKQKHSQATARYSALPQRFSPEKPLLTQALSIAQTAIAIMASAQIYALAGGTTWPINIPGDLLPAVLAAASMIVLEVVLVETARAVRRGNPLLATWRNSLLRILPVEGALAGMSLFMLLLYKQMQELLTTGAKTGMNSHALEIVFIALMIVIPCWLLYYSYKLFLEMRHAYERTLRTLAGLLEARLPRPAQNASAPGERSLHVAQWAGILGEQLGLPMRQIEQIRFAGYLLEVGKIGLPRDLLTKSNFSNPRQRKAYAHHADLGSQILEPVEFLRPIAHLVRHHQERYDGLGYPDGIWGERIPLGSRILAVAQTYVHLVEGEETGFTMEPQQALTQIVASRGVRFDPKVTDALAQALLYHRLLNQQQVSQAVQAAASPAALSRL